MILTYNEAQHIVDCVDSLGWADQIVVFDSYSEDGTVDLARQAGAVIGQATFENYAQQRNAALEFVGSGGRSVGDEVLGVDWVLFVDADERGTPELGREIRQVIEQRPEAAWFVPRHNYIFGRLTTGAGWYPDYQLRLLQLGRAVYERPVHEVAVVDGDIGHLRNTLVHYNYDNPAHFHAKQQRYTAYDASLLKQQGVRPKAYTPYTQGLRQFWWRFGSLKGYRDGRHGLRLSAYLAYYEWLKYRRLAALWRSA
ncbi:MAG TPA: glycosyltransferase family 2 protein [Anaerolineae bacterium]|nr:glycosyltransferase family 2 protein [Anaerolineae bacterium]